jgi:hypothetical protein
MLGSTNCVNKFEMKLTEKNSFASVALFNQKYKNGLLVTVALASTSPLTNERRFV